MKTSKLDKKVASVDEEDDDSGNIGDSGSSSVSSESEDDEEIVLEGELVRNPNASSSSESDDDDLSENNKNDKSEGNKKEQPKDKIGEPMKKRKPLSSQSDKAIQKKNKKSKEALENVEFIFCDMDESKYWDGCKALLTNSSTVYQKYASTWTDWLMEQVVGTVVSTTPAFAFEDNVVFAFASLVTVREDNSNPSSSSERVQCMNSLRQHAMTDCPAEYRVDMEKLLDEQCPLLVFLHGRMVNLPLEIVLALHQQVWLDWEWDHDDDDDDEQGIQSKPAAPQKKRRAGGSVLPIVRPKEPRILRLAPCTKSKQDNLLLYRFYDDELLASHAIVSYTVKAPPSYSKEEPLFLQVLVLTPEHYHQSIQDLEALVGG